MADNNTFVPKIRSRISELTEAIERARAVRAEYTYLGGADFIYPYFVEADGTTPRTDRGVSQQDIINAMATLDALFVSLDAGNDSKSPTGHGHNLYVAKG